MLIKFFKLVLIFLFFQSPLYSKKKTFDDFNLDLEYIMRDNIDYTEVYAQQT